MLKGWVDRTFMQGVAWELPDGANRIRPLLTNIGGVTVVTTHGSSKPVNMLEGEAGKRTVSRSMRLMFGRRARFRWLALYGVDSCTDADRAGFIRQVEQKMSRLR
jgi:putative NADPH-quinone reductase